MVYDATSVVGRTLEDGLKRLREKEPEIYAAMPAFIDSHVCLHLPRFDDIVPIFIIL